jgi:Flp pilus assembly protein TadD
MIRRIARTLSVVPLCFAGIAFAATADEMGEINQLYAAGRADDAFAQLDKDLARQPNDSQLRFLKGVLLSESGRRDQAAAVFEQLTIDFPDMPEPYNNLAVIYAAEGMYDKAVSSLQTAVRMHPGFAVAQQNLGDVYVQLARLSYVRAQKLDPSDATVAPKLAALRGIVTPAAASSPDGASAPR